MRILIYSYNYSPEPIGIAPLMTELAEGLVQQGHEVRVVTGMPNYPQRRIYEGYRGKLYSTQVENGVTVQRCYVWIRPKPGLLARIMLDASFVLTSIFQALRGDRPDVILLTVPPLPVAVPAALLSRLFSCPVILNVQDILPEAAVHLGLVKNPRVIRLFEALEAFAYRTATAIAVIADSFTDNLVQKGVPPAKLTCIPNWVDVNFIQPLPKVHNRYRQQHQLEDKFVVLYSGNIALTQGMETVMDAAGLLQQELPQVRFLIVGEAQACQQLQHYCQARAIANVLFLDFQPREALPELMAAADVSLLVQRRNVVSFNMPSKFQLILASGRPVLASVPPQGSAARAVSQSGAGVIVPPEQPQLLAAAIRQLHSDPQRLAELGLQGRRYAIAHYSFDSALSRYTALFQRVLQQSLPALSPIAGAAEALSADLQPLALEPLPLEPLMLETLAVDPAIEPPVEVLPAIAPLSPDSTANLGRPLTPASHSSPVR